MLAQAKVLFGSSTVGSSSISNNPPKLPWKLRSVCLLLKIHTKLSLNWLIQQITYWGACSPVVEVRDVPGPNEHKFGNVPQNYA